MDINEFTEKFQQIEIEINAFGFQDQSGEFFWDAVRYSVFNYIYQQSLGGSTLITKPSALSKLKKAIKRIVSTFAQKLIIKNFKKSKKNILLVKCSRHFNKDKWQDNIVTQLEFEDGKYVEIETSMSRQFFFHVKYLFSYSEITLPAITTNHLETFNSAVYSIFKIKVSINEVVCRNLAIFYAEFNFYNTLFKETNINKVFMVQNGIQKGLFKAALQQGVEVNEFQHGYIGYTHPAYSYPELTYSETQLFLPKRLLTYSDFWHKGYYLPVVDFVEVGSGNHHIVKSFEEFNNDILVISANIYHADLASLVISLTSVLPEAKFKYKLHPNQFENFDEIELEFSKYKNIQVFEADISMNECLKLSRHILCIQSTAVYEALQAGNYVYCYKRQNYNNHNNVSGLESFTFFDNIDDFVKLFTIRTSKEQFIDKSVVFFKKLSPKILNNLSKS
ncbi:MAG: hypothetical protein ACJAXS_001416 [Colwellia sp.]|jgi:hypothetical protein